MTIRKNAAFYEREAINVAWNVQTLKRQYHSGLYERLVLSRDKHDVIALATRGAILHYPADILKSPYVLECAGLDDKISYHENDLEFAVLNKLQGFLLEMGKGLQLLVCCWGGSCIIPNLKSFSHTYGLQLLNEFPFFIFSVISRHLVPWLTLS